MRVAALLAGGIGLVERSVRGVAGIRFPGGESSGGSASSEILPRIGARGLGPGASEAVLPLLLQPLHFQLQRPVKDHTQYNDSDLKAQKNAGWGGPGGQISGKGGGIYTIETSRRRTSRRSSSTRIFLSSSTMGRKLADSSSFGSMKRRLRSSNLCLQLSGVRAAEVVRLASSMAMESQLSVP
ncbi:hypothetical protein PanWU01x14_235230 [Parasponia andersonii]|uniref:Uncharacterized protein n=1 Tax=Parasponia andersonii TaxID=3476 RepID=A0A2P5BJ46_PARAD|nr:hypothetical protein PanWU01x14_235230 [Parasponia andersonii]